MKNTRALAMLALSLLIGGLALTMAVRWMKERSSVTTTDVVVAAKDIQLGTQLAPEMIKVVHWPAQSKPAGAFSSESALPGRVLNASVVAGEPIVEAKLAAAGSKGGLSALIAPGNRAISVKVNEVMGVAGFALPGNYVDVLVHAEDDQDRPFSRIVLEHILVLAVDQESSRDETKPKVVKAVTLQVTPAEAEKLDLARGIGTLSLALRNQIDTAAAETRGAKVADLVSGSQQPAPVAAAAPAPEAAPAPAPVADKPAPARRPVVAARKPAPRKAEAKPAATAPAPQPTAPARPSYIEGVQVSE